jgi:hypothetical protein
MVFPLYGYVGNKLKKNYIAWGFIGWAIMISFIIISSPFLYFFSNPVYGTLYWTSVTLFSPIFSLLFVIYIGYRHHLFFRKPAIR